MLILDHSDASQPAKFTAVADAVVEEEDAAHSPKSLSQSTKTASTTLRSTPRATQSKVTTSSPRTTQMRNATTERSRQSKSDSQLDLTLG